MPQQPAVLMQSRREMMASLLAMGLGPERCVIYEQSRVPEHTELAWILNTVAPVGYLNRMTQWKSKLNLDPNATNVTEVADTAGLNLGLFSYPVLQAADILLHKATHVPVGEDQLQHLELARHLARTFNKKFSKKSRVFPEPRPMLTPTKRVMSLRDPTKKMSKSDPNPASRILVTDEPAEIQKKLARAVTDSTLGITYDPTNRPGLATLITIHAGLTARSDDPESVAKEFASMGHHEYKAVVADCVAEYFGGFRGEYERLMKEPELLEEISRKGGEKARITARETMRKVKTVVGLA
ncbi:Tryptophan--tRNA ligase, mitochondrial [Saitoella coloradoensis]